MSAIPALRVGSRAEVGGSRVPNLSELRGETLFNKPHLKKDESKEKPAIL